MTSTQKIIIGSLGLLIVALFSIAFHRSPQTAFGGVSGGNEYSYSTTTGSFANASSTMIRIGPGVLGSINVGTVSATTFRLQDATSTADIASTTLFSGQASITGTYQFDMAFNRGLFIEFPASFVGRYTITYR